MDIGVGDSGKAIMLQVADPQNKRTRFTLRSGTPLSKLIDAYLEVEKLDRENVNFVFLGTPVHDEDTPDSLDMDAGDVVDVTAGRVTPSTSLTEERRLAVFEMQHIVWELLSYLSCEDQFAFCAHRPYMQPLCEQAPTYIECRRRKMVSENDMKYEIARLPELVDASTKVYFEVTNQKPIESQTWELVIKCTTSTLQEHHDDSVALIKECISRGMNRKARLLSKMYYAGKKVSASSGSVKRVLEEDGTFMLIYRYAGFDEMGSIHLRVLRSNTRVDRMLKVVGPSHYRELYWNRDSPVLAATIEI